MANQTFKLIDSNKKEVGVISKTDDGKMILSLNGFWGAIYSKKMKLINVDDFVGSIFWGDTDTRASAAVECASGSCDDLMVHFDGQKYVGSVEISIYAPIIGQVFKVTVDDTIDVTGKVMLSSL